MINNIEITSCINKINKKLLSNRISVALFSFGLNEFYVAFKYLKSILIYTFNKNNISKTSIKNAILEISKIYKVTDRTILMAISKLYKNLPSDFFTSSLNFVKMKMNCYLKTEFIAKKVLKELQKY